MFKYIKKKLKKFNIKYFNILNFAPKFFSQKEILFLKNKNLNKLLNINLFYFNQKFNFFFWSEILKRIDSKKKFNNNFFFSEIKKNFNKKSNILQLLSIYQVLIIIGQLSLAHKVREYFFIMFDKMNFFLKSPYLYRLSRISTLLHSSKKFTYLQNKKIIKKLLIDNYSNYRSRYLFKNNFNKKVALVGVGPKSNDQKELKCYDIHVFLNIFSKSKLLSFSKFNISYLSDYFYDNKKHLIENNLNLKFYVIKKKINVTKFRNYEITNCDTYDDLIYGTPSLLINSLLDLIKKKFLKLKVFQSTLYYPVGGKIFDKKQKSYFNFKKNQHIGSFYVHDPISEYLIMYNLYKFNFIKTDSNLKKVLNLGIRKYLAVMEKYYKQSFLQQYSMDT